MYKIKEKKFSWYDYRLDDWINYKADHPVNIYEMLKQNYAWVNWDKVL